MQVIKRFAFWPLLALVTAVVFSAVANPDHGSNIAAGIGVVASIPLAYAVDRRRTRRSQRLLVR